MKPPTYLSVAGIVCVEGRPFLLFSLYFVVVVVVDETNEAKILIDCHK